MSFTLILGMAWHGIGRAWKARGQGPSSVPVARREVGLRSFHPQQVTPESTERVCKSPRWHCAVTAGFPLAEGSSCPSSYMSPHSPTVFPFGLAQETHQQLADKKSLHVVEFRDECGPLPIVAASPRGGLRKDPEPEDDVPDVKLDWEEVKAAQGMKRSVWSGLKRAAT